jgi:membrane-associated phospholipid phosphatase
VDLDREAFNETYTKFKQGFFPADILLLFFSLFLLLIGIFNYGRLGRPYLWISTDCGIIGVLLMLIYREQHESRNFYHWLHFLWPILTLATIYTQCTSWDNLLFPQTFDPILARWDRGLFGVSLNRIMAPAVGSLWMDELMHFFYFSYYLVLLVPAAWLFRQRKIQAFGLVFSLILMLYIHFIFFMLFPGDGPIPERRVLFGKGIMFIPLMDFIYQMSEQSGGGAFPSTHVASAVLIYLYMIKYFPKLRLPGAIICSGIVLATVYCSYHYAIDSVAGLFTGGLFFLLGEFIYTRWLNPTPAPFVAIQQST